MLLIVDADALIAMADCSHEFHNRSKEIAKNIAKYRVPCIYPLTAICEAVTVLQKKLLKPESAQFLLKLVKNGTFTTEDIHKELLLEALSTFNPHSLQRGDTLFDAIIATIAYRCKADAVFSFDQGYRRKGLRLASDLF
jgi:predicted nucleic acid-binding protein